MFSTLIYNKQGYKINFGYLNVANLSLVGLKITFICFIDKMDVVVGF